MPDGGMLGMSLGIELGMLDPLGVSLGIIEGLPLWVLLGWLVGIFDQLGIVLGSEEGALLLPAKVGTSLGEIEVGTSLTLGKTEGKSVG